MRDIFLRQPERRSPSSPRRPRDLADPQLGLGTDLRTQRGTHALATPSHSRTPRALTLLPGSAKAKHRCQHQRARRDFLQRGSTDRDAQARPRDEKQHAHRAPQLRTHLHTRSRTLSCTCPSLSRPPLLVRMRSTIANARILQLTPIRSSTRAQRAHRYPRERRDAVRAAARRALPPTHPRHG